MPENETVGRVGRGPGRPSAIGAVEIAQAVLDVGFPSLTFANVAARLRVGQATLYRHAANRDELIRLGLDRAIRAEAWPSEHGDWRAVLTRWSLASWGFWTRHPGAVAEAARGVVPSAVVEITDRVGAALVRLGFTASNAVLAVDLVFDLAADSRRGVESLDAARASLGGGSAPMRDALVDGWSSTGVVQTPITGSLRIEMVRAIQEEPRVWFRRKLAVVLAGIEHELAPRPEHARPESA